MENGLSVLAGNQYRLLKVSKAQLIVLGIAREGLHVAQVDNVRTMAPTYEWRGDLPFQATEAAANEHFANARVGPPDHRGIVVARKNEKQRFKADRNAVLLIISYQGEVSSVSVAGARDRVSVTVLAWRWCLFSRRT